MKVALHFLFSGIAALWAFQISAQNAAIPALSEEPGQSSIRAPDGSYGVETIDPFTGALKIVATDLVVPSNGGLDITIVRNYTSLQNSNSTIPAPSHIPGRTTTGIGWDINLGRLWRYSSSAGYTLPVGSNCGGSSLSIQDSRYNPVLELPDGSRHVLVTADTNGNYKFITSDRWIARCSSTGDGGLVVVSPQGIQYRFDKLGRVASGGTANALAFHPTRIEHPNGTSISITYAGVGNEFLRVDTITHSEGQSVSFTYDDPTGGNARLRTIRLNGTPTRTWTYDYTVAWSPLGGTYYYLSKVTRPDGLAFDYDYYTSTGTGQYSLKSIETPLDATVTYTYQSQLFPRHAEGSIPRVVVSTKHIGGSVDTAATWTYAFNPADTAGELTDVTTVSGPNNCVRYEHQSATSSNEQLWRIGLLLDKQTRTSCSGSTLRREEYTWGSQTVAAQDYWRAPNVSDSNTYAPRLDSVKTTQDGSIYTTAYSNYDSYGNARQIVESGQDSRTTTRTFVNDTSRWIVQLLDDETVASAGTVYTTSTSGVTADYVVNRTFYANGNLNTESRGSPTASVGKSYVWHTSGASQGEINTVTDATVKVITYTNYKRGQPQNEAHPLSVSISRVINNTGTTASEIDPRSRQTVFDYDQNEELISLQTPKTTDDNLAIQRGDPADSVPIGDTSQKRKRTLTRGTYKEVRVFDGLGKQRQINLTDTATGRLIVKGFLIDAEGRVSRSYLPNYTSTSPDYETFTYDDLGRPETIVHDDGTQVRYEYLSNNRVRVTDERGFLTTYSYRSYGSPDQKDLIKIEANAAMLPSDSPITVTTDILRNKLGQVTAVTQGGLTRTYRYDSKFLLTYEIDPELGTITYGRDGAGNLTSKSVGTSGNTIYTLDDLYRVDLITYPSSATPSVDFNYFADGSLQYVVKGNTRWDYTYDSNNNPETENATIAAIGYGITYAYDGRDSLASVTYPSGLIVSYAPNSFGQATLVSSGAGSHVSGITYFANGQFDTMTYANGYTLDYGQNTRLLPTTLRTSAIRNGSSYDLVNLNHRYDNAANLQYLDDYRDPSKNRSMTYDGMNRLRGATGPYAANGGTGTGNFTYDARNNILTKNFPTQSLTYTYNSSTGRLDSIAGAGASSYSYDVYGNVTSNGRNQLGYGVFAYDHASNLVSVGSPARIQYTYDGNNRIAIDARADGSSSRVSVYTLADKRLYDIDTVNYEATDYIYLGSTLVASRSRCTSSTDGDGDGIPTCVEWRNGMNPASSSDAAMDADADGLSNLQEYQAGTNIFNADSDGDALSDEYEKRYGLNPLVSNSNTDTDGDGLTNLQEFQLHTRPDKADTDGDGIPDNLDPKPTFNPAVLIPILQMILE